MNQTNKPLASSPSTSAHRGITWSEPGKESSIENQAQWIWPQHRLPEGEDTNQIVDFLHSFELESLTGDEYLLISADTDFILWLNGEPLGHGQFPTFPNAKTYERFALQGQLRKGKNTIAITVYYNGVNCSVYLRGKAGLAFSVQNTTHSIVSGKGTQCRINPAYHNGAIDKVSGQLSHTFAYDARKNDSFFQDGFTPDESWTTITQGECDLPPERLTLSPRPIKRLADTGLAEGKEIKKGSFTYLPKLAETKFESLATKDSLKGLTLENGTVVHPAWMMMSAELNPKSSQDETGSFYIYDLGQEEAGHLSFELEASSGTVVDISYGEHLDDDRVRAAIGSRRFGSRYICQEGLQTFYHPFLRWSGRYLQVHIHQSKAKILSIGLVRKEYQVVEKAFPENSSPIQSEILKVGYRTLRLSMHDHYEDTPWREQALYANDARTQALCGYYAFGETDMPKASFDLLGQGLREDGLLNLTAPAKPPPTIPSFTLVWILAIRDHFLYSNDPALAKAYLPQIRSMLDIFISEMEDDLFPLKQAQGIWHFYDWSGDMHGYEDADFSKGLKADIPLNCFFILALQATQEMLSWVGEKDDELNIVEERVRAAATQTFWDSEQKLFRTHLFTEKTSELTQSLAVLAKLGNDQIRQQLIDQISSPSSNLVESGLSQSLYVFDALLSGGPNYHPLILNRIEKTWGKMLSAGATSFWETINGGDDFHKAGSLCHGWSAVPVYVLFRILNSTQPIKPGDFTK